METILVTGGAGFIGTWVCEKLLRKEYKVVSIDNFANTYPKAFKEENLKSLNQYPNLIFKELDLISKDAVGYIFKEFKIDRIIHLAARAGVRPSINKPGIYFATNIGGTVNLLQVAKNYPIKQIIIASSSSVYGNNPTPFKESDPADSPISPYGASKRGAEIAALTFNSLTKTPTIILRFFSVYGPQGRPDMAPYLFLKSILGGKPVDIYNNGTMARDWTYISDVVDGIVATLRLTNQFEIINLGNNKPITTNNLLSSLEEIAGKKAKRNYTNAPPGDVKSTHADINLAKNLLCWEPKTGLRAGLTEFVTWYKSERLSKEA